MEKKQTTQIAPEENTVKTVESPDAVIADLEKKGYEKAAEVLPGIIVGNKDAGDQLMSFMSSGAEDFEKRTGRKMTYGEMRAAWG
jgi:hypothetical protein